MLPREESRERLLEFIDLNALANLQMRVAKAPKKLKTLAEGFIQYLSQSEEKHGYISDETYGYKSKVKFEVDHWRTLGEGLEQLNSKEKLSLFEILFPKFPEAALAAWELKKTQPYQQGYSRRSFRFKASHPVQLEAASKYIRTLLIDTLAASEDLEWFATWAAYIHRPMTVAPLLAAGINVGDSKVYDILYASLVGDHEIAAMGRHVLNAFMMCDKEEAWIAVEKTLLAAQRQEGLRQSILTYVDESHPEAYKRMLRLIAEHNLSRFSASVSSVNVWFGFQFETGQSKKLDALLVEVADYFDDEAKRQEALNNGSGQELFLALWTIAYHDVEAALEAAQNTFDDADDERRFAAAHLAKMLGTKNAQQALLPLLHDESLQIALTALDSFRMVDGSFKHLPSYFEEVETFIARLPNSKTKKLESIIWPWNERVLEREKVVNVLFSALEDRPITRLMPYLGDMDSYGKGRVIRLLTAQAKATDYNDTSYRDALLQFVTDRNSSVSETAIKEVAKFGLRSEDVEMMEGLLTRKTASLRRSILTLLLSQDDAAVFESIDRLTVSRKAPVRFAGLELLSELKKAERQVEKTQEITKAFQEAKGDSLTAEEETIVTGILQGELEIPTRLDGFGLFDPNNLVEVKAPISYLAEQGSKSGVAKLISKIAQTVNPSKATASSGTQVEVSKRLFVSDNSKSLIETLDAFIHNYRETPVKQRYSQEEALLGNVRFLQRPYAKPKVSGRPQLYDASGFETVLEKWQDIALWETWQSWWDEQQLSLKKTSDFEAVQALVSLNFAGWRSSNARSGYYYERTDSDWPVQLELYGNQSYDVLNYRNIVSSLLEWFFYLDASRQLEPTVDFLLDSVETSIAHAIETRSAWWKKESKRIEAEKAKLTDPNAYVEQRRFAFYMPYIAYLQGIRLHSFELWTESQQKRYFDLVLLRANNRHILDLRSGQEEFQDVMFAWQKGWVSDDYIYASFVGLTGGDVSTNVHFSLANFTGLIQNKAAEPYPKLQQIVENCRDKVVEIELARADLPTEASDLAMNIRTIYGADKALFILKSLDRNGLVRGYTWGGGKNKGDVFSRLLRGSHPSEDDTEESFAKQAKALKLKEQRLVDLAMYAPQWADFVEKTVGWKGLVEAVYWLHAHTKDTSWSVDKAIRDSWTAEVSERTPLSAKDLLDGAVDVSWFKSVYKELGAERWKSIDAAAKYGSSSGGHKRAQLFADALLGELDAEACIERLQAKRHQDSVRALGLIPLPKAKKAAKAEVLARYEVIQTFIHGSRKFGSQRKASERLCADVGLANLARTAGYQDPQRLMWAMEAEACADLAKGPISVTEGETTVSLYIDDDAKVQLDVVKVVKGKEKKLKAVPAKLKKHPEISILRERKTELTKQTSRMRLSLEESMIRGDLFSATEFVELCQHPLLKAMLTDLLFITEDGALGFPIKDGKSLEAYDKSEIQLGKTMLRIAHPYDLLECGNWTEWQKNCFDLERKQSFKQIFRELYVCSEAEQKTPLYSKRYEGHQVESRQAVGILGKRSWIPVHEEGLRKSFHSEGISAWIYFDHFYYSAGDSDGLTTDTVAFTHRDKAGLLPLEEVPPRLFSEVMRDLDLMVSVAHRGGVDPEASASTVEMRTNLLRETLQLLKIDNVRLENTHALIEGELGSYSVHMGSANVHRQPGGYVCIIPVHSQHRGRIFLPFADDDPKTAEVISKVIMLAKDKQIKDPTILEQIL